MKTESQHEAVLTIVETPFEKQMRAVRERNIEADTICRERLRRWALEDAAWQLLVELRESLPKRTGGIPQGAIDLGESVPQHARLWPQ